MTPLKFKNDKKEILIKQQSSSLNVLTDYFKFISLNLTGLMIHLRESDVFSI